ncbi:MAG: penicillin-binding protein 2 [candidate division WOR-3 bacterium]
MNRDGRRLRLLKGFLTLLWVGLVVRLAWVQIFRGGYLEREAESQHLSRRELLPQRGRLFDRFGRGIALNRLCCSIWIMPRYVRDKDGLADIFAVFGLGKREAIRRSLEENKNPFWFRRKVDYGIADFLRKVLVMWHAARNCTLAVLVEDDNLRVYPYKEVCANITGFVGCERGLAGLECEFDSLLRGRPGWIMLQRDGTGGSYPYPSYPMKPPLPGADLHLTLDLDIQQIAFQVLASAVTRTQALKGAAIVLDAQTGAVRALVDYPTYDPERFQDFDASRYKSSAVSDQFEPGSSFKLVICAAALESPGMPELTTRSYDVSAGYFEVQGRKLHDVHKNGVLSFDSLFINSSNAGCALLSTKIEPEHFYTIAQGLGFTNPVGIGLPNEGAGWIDPPKRLTPLRLANNAFGQGLTVTLVQMAAAYLCVANDGIFLRPYLIESVRSRGRVVAQFGPVEVRRVLKPETARRIKEILSRVVTNGTGTRAAIPGVSVAGKTGTAQKVEPNGQYSMTRSRMTFIGFFPVETPRYLIAVLLDEPKTDRFAGTAACPVFREIGIRLLELERLRRNPEYAELEPTAEVSSR